LRLDSKNHYTLRGRGWAKFQKGIYEDSIRDLSDALEFILPTENDAWQETLRGLGGPITKSRVSRLLLKNSTGT